MRFAFHQIGQILPNMLVLEQKNLNKNRYGGDLVRLLRYDDNGEWEILDDKDAPGQTFCLKVAMAAAARVAPAVINSIEGGSRLQRIFKFNADARAKLDAALDKLFKEIADEAWDYLYHELGTKREDLGMLVFALPTYYKLDREERKSEAWFFEKMEKAWGLSGNSEKIETMTEVEATLRRLLHSSSRERLVKALGRPQFILPVDIGGHGMVSEPTPQDEDAYTHNQTDSNTGYGDFPS